MKKLIASLVSAGLLATAGIAFAGKYDGPRAKPRIVKALQHTWKVPDKTGPWRTNLQGKPGATVRRFEASNLRTVIMPGPAPSGAQGGRRVHVGNGVTGRLNTETGDVRVTGVTHVR